jgi:transglutaminase-like putative cysteine protease
MRLSIKHKTHYSYESPANSLIQILRITPSDHDGQYIYDWNLHTSKDVRLSKSRDAFGNIVHTFTYRGTLDEMEIIAEGEVETQDTGGIIKGTNETFPPGLYLRNTVFTETNIAMRSFANDIAASEESKLSKLHAINTAINKHIRFDTNATHTLTKAVDAFENYHGVCQDHAHIFLGCARYLGIPARYVSGHMYRIDGKNDQEAGHAWAEAYIDELGWVGFDPANGISTTDQHVRMAVALDYFGASPARGTQTGGRNEKLDVEVILKKL